MVKELRPLCPNAVRAGWPVNLMNAYNQQNTLASLTSGFQSFTHVDAPTAGQHKANGKRYATWADVEDILHNRKAMSMVILGEGLSWSCYILVHMFRVTYARKIVIRETLPLIDDYGFVFHSITLDQESRVYNTDRPVGSFGCFYPLTTWKVWVNITFLIKTGVFVGSDAKTWCILR
jgi:hypothetical protein